ncbi:membrane integrity-associated transporter subunit PqiC [Enterobacteriaceae bacterium BIT-l23]|uniref:membrane integrity-associated transporter subunit PqiC n=1 Tax=Jejubacter sp. L23 TaxID=3092086 RepID=UPI0015859F7C|nr:membrane integrity-associated transporter subunit PqiC [Enterobacteriaceae bacterium BIT-l23]
MKKWLALIVAAALSACSSSGDDKTYYQLPVAVQPVTQSMAQSSQRQLWVEQVAIPDYLAGNGLAYQTTDVQYTIANSNLWASPLDQQLRNTLVANLSAQLPGWVVSSQPLGSEQDVLSVNVTGFHGRYDGHTIVSGEWLLNHQGRMIKRPFFVELKQQEDGYDAMVKSLAQGWQQATQGIAGELTRLP